MQTRDITAIIILASLISSCSGDKKDHIQHTVKEKQTMEITVDSLKEVLEAFNRHDLDAIMQYFSDDCTFYFPRGPEPWGQRFEGKTEVRQALAGRFKGIPDVHYGNDEH